MAYRYNHILIRYGELSLKGKNRNNFIKALYDNVRKALKAFPTLEFEKQHDRIRSKNRRYDRHFRLYRRSFHSTCSRSRNLLYQKKRQIIAESGAGPYGSCLLSMT